MTKEECLDSLNQMKDSCECGEYHCVKKCDACDVIEQLINEHFDNTPLMFEELKPNMWVWDNKQELYIYVVNINDKSKVFNEEYSIDTEDYYDCEKFEENRFYKYEVKEDEC